MLNRELNERICRVGPGTPMGRMMRRYWHPVARTIKLEADGAPLKFRLLGENFILFRANDGRLTCLYHGWRFDVSGKVIDCPTGPPDRREAFAAKVRREAGARTQHPH